MLDNEGFKVIAYADDIMILVLAMFSDVFRDIIATALDLLSNWATICDQRVNPSKMVLFC